MAKKFKKADLTLKSRTRQGRHVNPHPPVSVTLDLSLWGPRNLPSMPPYRE